VSFRETLASGRIIAVHKDHPTFRINEPSEARKRHFLWRYAETMEDWREIDRRLVPQT